MGAKPSKGTVKDGRLRENQPQSRPAKPDPKPSQRQKDGKK